MENVTDADPLARLAIAAKHKMTPVEIREQRVSFVYGQMNGSLTRDQIRAKLAAHLGWDVTDH